VRRFAPFLLLVLTIPLVVGCGDDGADVSTGTTGDDGYDGSTSQPGVTGTEPAVTGTTLPLVGTQWILSAIVEGTGSDASVRGVPAGVEAWLRLDENGFAVIRPGCNNGTMTYRVSGDTITFGPIALTKMACPGEPMEVEQAVLDVLDGMVTMSSQGSVLSLRSDDAGLDFRVAS
jgi:heat shock protein HslJ